MFARNCSFYSCLFLLCVRIPLEPQRNIKKTRTTKGPTVCLVELGEENKISFADVATKNVVQW